MTGNTTLSAQTLTGTKVTINDFDIIIEDGKPLLMFFTKDDDGQYGIFNQHQLTNYKEE